MRVALIEPPIIRPTNDADGISCEAPLALTSLAATLLEKNHDVIIIDALAEGYKNHDLKSNGQVYIGLSFPQILKKLNDFKAEVVGISCLFYFNLPITVDLTNYIKNNTKNIHVVLGGLAPAMLYDKVMANSMADFIINSEGDHILPELLEHLTNPSFVPGIIWRHDKKTIVNKKAKLPDPLDDLPFPARQLVDLDLYIKINRPFGFVKEKKRYTTILTSRGCPFSCTFCSASAMHGKCIRYRSPENIILEIDELVSKYNINELHIIDENISLDKKRFLKIMDSLIERGYHKSISWTCPNGLFIKSLDEEVIDKMQASNCHSVALAVESGDYYVSKNIIKKPIDHKQVERVVKYFQKHTNILLCGYFIIGFPGETKQQIIKTINFANKLNTQNSTISILMPYPFTKIYDQALKNRQLLIRHDDNNFYSSLLPKQGLIKTKDFDPLWLKSIQETDRFLSLLRKKRKRFMPLFWELIKRTKSQFPKVIAMILYHVIKGDISGKR